MIARFQYAFLFPLFLSTHVQSQDIVKPLPPEVALTKASMQGKYVLLLQKIHAPKDIEKHGPAHDAGFLDRTEPAGANNPPTGYWVYVYPHWYVWDEKAEDLRKRDRRWGPEQITGKPDTKQAGDLPTAWASRTADGSDEWLILEYEHAVVPTAVLVYESYNPGALVKVTAFRLTGEEVEVWKGSDPTSVGAGKGVSTIPLQMSFKTNRIKLHLASARVSGWNEIDAVGLQSNSHSLQWARAASASTTYAAPRKR